MPLINQVFLLSQLRKFPRLKEKLRNLYYYLHGITPGEINAETLRRCIVSSPPTIIEIGANDGAHTQLFLQLFPNAQVFCFEPDPRAAVRWRRKIGDRPRVRLDEAAVSDRDGEVVFFQSDGGSEPGGHDASGSIRRPKSHLTVSRDVTFDRSLVVPTVTLDSYCARHGIEGIDLLWMDVQGAEIDVVRGGRATLSRTRFVYTEYSNLELYEGQASLRKLLSELPAFRVQVRYPCDVLLENIQSS